MLGQNVKNSYQVGPASLHGRSEAFRDCFCKVQKDFTWKKAHEERASGICPHELDEVEQALEDITEMEESQ